MGMMFGKTWGAPYDPHSYLNSWSGAAHAESSALGGLEPPLTKDGLLAMINDAQLQTDTSVISAKWEEIHQAIHSQAIFLPLWGTRVPYVLNRRFTGFTPSTMMYTYPIKTVRIMTGSKEVTVAAGTSGGDLLTTVGAMNPHLYGLNQLFAQDWLYEGLVGYGQDGEITPVLAKSWTELDLPSGGRKYTFTLREDVKFHDGSEWNCSVDKARFIKEEFAGLEQPVTQLLPFNTPFCNVDLNPKWAYDFEKAELLNCPVMPSPSPPPAPSSPPMAS